MSFHSVYSQGYFKQIGFIEGDIYEIDEEKHINTLFDMALSRMVFLPFAYLVDKYRWDLFSKEVDEDDSNCHWVKLRLDIQGMYI